MARIVEITHINPDMKMAAPLEAAAGMMPMRKVPTNGSNSKNVSKLLSCTAVMTSCCSLDH